MGSHSLTQGETNTEKLSPNSPKQDTTCIANIVNLTMVQFKSTNHIVGPCCDASNEEKANDARNDSEGVEGRWYG